jgi:RNA polymerase sigma-70 factor (ECF subfamily)
LSPLITVGLFRKYYEEYYDKIFNYIFRNVYRRELAEDLTSSTFLKAFRFIKEHKPNIENFSSWLYRIATNEVLKDYRKKGKKMFLSIDDEALQLKDFIEDTNADVQKRICSQIDLRKAFKRLKPKEVIIIELYFFEHKKYSEIASMLKIRENTLRSLLHRILKKLKEYLEDYYYEAQG